MTRILMMALALLMCFGPTVMAGDAVADEAIYDCSKVESKRDLYFAYMSRMDYYLGMRDVLLDEGARLSSQALIMLINSSLSGALGGGQSLTEAAYDELSRFSVSVPEAFEVKAKELAEIAGAAAEVMMANEHWMMDGRRLSGPGLSAVRRQCETAVHVDNLVGFRIAILVPYRMFLEEHDLIVAYGEQSSSSEPKTSP